MHNTICYMQISNEFCRNKLLDCWISTEEQNISNYFSVISSAGGSPPPYEPGPVQGFLPLKVEFSLLLLCCVDCNWSICSIRPVKSRRSSQGIAVFQLNYACECTDCCYHRLFGHFMDCVPVLKNIFLIVQKTRRCKDKSFITLCVCM